MKKLVLAAAALLASTAMPAAAAELITNGNFEAGTTGFTLQDNVTVASGAAYAAGAQAVGSQAALNNHFITFGTGNVGGKGVVFQGFNTVLGQTYTLSFDYGAFNSSNQQLTYTVNGVQGVPLVPITSGTNNLDALFHNYTSTFIGTGGSTVLSFQSTSNAGDNADILLDNVSVQGPVPEPATWAMMLMGFGMVGFGLRSRRKQNVRVTYA